MKKYTTVVSGGTFDHLHIGHEAFLKAQLELSENILLGVTSDAYIAAGKAGDIESFETRLAQIKLFLQKEEAEERVTISAIDNAYIPAIWQTISIEAIVVTDDTKKGADLINQKRVVDKQDALPIKIVPSVFAKDGKLLSSFRIRNGEIDREGDPYINDSWISHTLFLPEYLRAEIQKPFGKVFADIDAWITKVHADPFLVISVGDVVTEELQKRKYGQKISVVDLFVQRKQAYGSLAEHTLQGDETIIRLSNASGTISPRLFHVAKESIQNQGRYIIQIEGEEDLAVLPFLLLAPLSYHILYGQPGKGIVDVLVTEERKNTARNLVKKFTNQPQNT